MIGDFETIWLDDPDGLTRYEKLLKMRDMESKAMVNHGRAMRINQHTLLKAETAATQSNKVPAKQVRPWD